MNCDNEFWIGCICGMAFYLLCHALARAPTKNKEEQAMKSAVRPENWWKLRK